MSDVTEPGREVDAYKMVVGILADLVVEYLRTRSRENAVEPVSAIREEAGTNSGRAGGVTDTA